MDTKFVHRVLDHNKIVMFVCLLIFVCVWCCFSWQGSTLVGRLNVDRLAPNSLLPGGESQTNNDVACQPKHRLVFIKTHKTGSGTVNTILHRYGYTRDLNFVLPTTSHIFPEDLKFKASSAYQYDLKDTNGTLVVPAIGGFHIMANHGRYNRNEQDSLIPNAFYFTIIRDPASQLESAFSYFGFSKFMPHHKITDLFLMDSKHFIGKRKRMAFLRNGQMYDLGLDQEDQSPKSVDDKMQSLSEEMDLVMITEYFDESLILLKKMLCWDFDDIIYISQHVRKAEVRSDIKADLRKQIYKWNHADVKLYQHFNTTLWGKIQNYGPGFQRDLNTFRELKTVASTKCLKNATVYFDGRQTSIVKLLPNASEKCRYLARKHTDWMPILRRNLDLKCAAFMNRNA